MSRQSRYWYVLVDRKTGVPILVKDSPSKLAEVCGVTIGAVCAAASMDESGRYNARFKRVPKTEKKPFANAPDAFYWIEVTRDKFEYPVRVCETVQELAEATGRTVDSIRSMVSHYEAGQVKKPRFKRVLKT